MVLTNTISKSCMMMAIELLRVEQNVNCHIAVPADGPHARLAACKVKTMKSLLKNVISFTELLIKLFPSDGV